MSSADIDELMAAWERPAFFDGQGLTAGDLTQAQRYQRDMRWLHNRTLHSWGVVVGLAVTAKKGDISVDVTGGYALDWKGRELIVAPGRKLAVPALAEGTRYLTLSYIEDAAQLKVQSRSGACATAGAVRLAEAAELRWRDPQDTGAETAYQPGVHVLLATVSIKDCALASISLAGRREARSGVSPRVHAGSTPAGGTVWRLWTLGPASDILGVETNVDTSAGGFVVVPRYTAQIAGLRGFLQPLGFRLLDGFARVTAPKATGFLLQVLLPQGLGFGMEPLNPVSVMDPALPELVGSTLKWHVNWLGVEG
jgi:hypothetical protein